MALKTYLDLGASPNYKDANGLTPLFYSIIHKSNPKITQLLLYERSLHGVADEKGWRELHHAAKLGLCAHIEQLIFYGADMDAKIVTSSGGSGNTPLHVAAINDQKDVIKILLKRGCNRDIVNHSHQNAYQVAVIANNLEASEMITKFKSENISLYRDRPKYNPNRKGVTTSQSSDVLSSSASARRTADGHLQGHPSGSNNGHGAAALRNVSNVTSSSSASPCPSSTTTSSGVCCGDSNGDCCSNHSHNSCAGNNGSGGGHGASLYHQLRSNGNGTVGTTSRVEGRREQKMVVTPLGVNNASCCSTLPVRSRLQQTMNGQLPSGAAFVAGGHHQLAPLIKQDSINSNATTNSNSSSSSPPLSNCSNNDSLLNGAKNQTITSYNEKTVSLHRGNKGFGFVLRGAKATSPMVTSTGHRLPGQSLIEPISLQYLDEIEEGGIAQQSGLSKGDFLLNVNGVDVRMAPHEMVVNLIRSSGDKVTMSVATPVYMKTEDGDADNDEEAQKMMKQKKMSEKRMKKLMTPISDQQEPQPVDAVNCDANSVVPNHVPQSESSSSMDGGDHQNDGGRGRSRMPPPAPPKRDPSTTLSVGRARARSLCISSGHDGHDNGSDNGHDDHRRNSTDTNTGSVSSSSDNGRHHLNSHQQFMEENHYQRPSIQPIPIDKKDVSKDKMDTDNTATIRSRGSRRMSAIELEEFFQRQEENSSPFMTKNGDNVKKYSKNNGDNRAVQTLKTRKLKKGKKDAIDDNSSSSSPSGMGRKTLSASDMQELLHLESSNQIKTIMDMKTGHRLNRSSQENLTNYLLMKNNQVSETVTLKNGKIISGVDNKKGTSPTNSSEGDRSSPRAPPPSHPPPPPPAVTTGHQVKMPIVVKVDHRESDYANYDELKGNGNNVKVSKSGSGQQLSSFKPPAPDPNDGVDGSNVVPKVEVSKSAPLSSQSKGILKKSNTNGGGKVSNVSVYSRSESNEDSSVSMATKITTNNSSLKQPFIPDPDYSTSEDETTLVNDTVPGTSTFKNNDDVQAKVSVAPTAPTTSLRRESPTKQRQRSASTDSMSSLPPPPPPLALEEDFDLSSNDGGQSPNKVSIVAGKNGGGQSELDAKNKVKLYAMQFERRSSLTSSTSGSESGSLGPSSGKKMVQQTSSSGANYDSLSDNNSSSGISSDVEPSTVIENLKSSCKDGSSDKQKMGSVLISNPNYAENRNAVVAAMNRKNNTSTLPSSMSSSMTAKSMMSKDGPKTLPKPDKGKRVSFEDDSFKPSSASSSSSSSAVGMQNSSSAESSSAGDRIQSSISSATKSAPKTWSEISSAIKAAKSTTNPVASPQKSSTNVPKAGQGHKRDTSSDGRRPQTAKDGLVNEVDVLAQLVPPPPEFAAPPPMSGLGHAHSHGQQQQSMAANQGKHKIQVQIKAPDAQQHIVQKPMVAKPTPTTVSSGGHINTIQINTSSDGQHQQHLSRIHAVDLLDGQQQMYQQQQQLAPNNSASARLGITLTQQQAAAYR